MGTPLHVSGFCCTPSQGLPRTTWQSFGLSSSSSCQKSLTTWPPSKIRRVFPSSCHRIVRRFRIPTVSNGLEESRNSIIIHKLHDILRPFLLRRLKVDVERTLPPKKEYLLYAPLSARQHEVYGAVVKGSLRGLLTGARPGEDARQRERDRIAREIEEDEKTGRVGTRTRKSRGSITPSITPVSEIGAEHAFKAKSTSLSARTTFLRPANTKMLVFVFGRHSEEGQQYAFSERRNAVTQSVLAPFPL